MRFVAIKTPEQMDLLAQAIDQSDLLPSETCLEVPPSLLARADEMIE